MAATRSFRETVKEELAEKDFRHAFLCEAVRAMGAGDLETVRNPKSLMRMLSPSGNPQARNLFEIVAYLQKIEGTVLEVRAKRAKAA
jgi:hypothetical protein